VKIQQEIKSALRESEAANSGTVMVTQKQEQEKSNEVSRFREQVDKIKTKIEDTREWWW
jgi:polyhydroxyalkanoate synthesis regulator phasin